MRWVAALASAANDRPRPAASAGGAQIDALAGQDGVVLAVIGGFDGVGAGSGAPAKRPPQWQEAWQPGRHLPGSRSDGCGGTLSAARGAGSDE